VAEHCGVNHVALGSDFDGATMPAESPDASAYQGVPAALEAAGFTEHEVDQIAWGTGGVSWPPAGMSVEIADQAGQQPGRIAQVVSEGPG
jgi:hypothetical protein